MENGWKMDGRWMEAEKRHPLSSHMVAFFSICKSSNNQKGVAILYQVRSAWLQCSPCRRRHAVRADIYHSNYSRSETQPISAKA